MALGCCNIDSSEPFFDSTKGCMMRVMRKTYNLREVSDLYASGFGSYDIAKLMGCSQGTVMNLLTDAKVERRLRKDYTTIKAKRAFFKVIDTELSAYWLGFVIADGHVSDYSVTVGLAEKDAAHVEKFRDALGSGHKIRRCSRPNGSDKVSVSVSSVSMVKDLRDLGILKNKSVSVSPPELAPNLVRHMIRGIFDGDGCLHIAKNGHPSITVIGSRQTCDFINRWISELTGYIPKMRQVGPVWVLAVRAIDPARKVLSEMYRDCSEALLRKYNKAAAFLGWIEK